MVKRILVGLGDMPYSVSATQQAIRLAQQADAELTAVTLLDLERSAHIGAVPIGASGAAAELREHRVKLTKEAIEQSQSSFERLCREAGIRGSLRPECDDPLEEFISVSRYHDITFCGLKNLFEQGSADDPPIELVRLVEGGVRPLVAVTQEDQHVRRVLIAYSGSVESAKTMKRFVQSYIWRDAAARIVTFGDDAELAGRLLTEAAAYCQAHGLNVETEHVAEDPKRELLKYAQTNDMDAIVLGNSAKRLLLRRVFGETAYDTISNADRVLFLSQ